MYKKKEEEEAQQATLLEQLSALLINLDLCFVTRI